MGHHLLLRGEAHLVSRDQISGSCIHHAPLLGVPTQSPKFLIAVAVIESPFRALLVSAARVSLLGGSREHCTGPGAVSSTTVAAAAEDQTAPATRAVSLDPELQHRKPTPKSWLPREHRGSCARTIAAHSNECSSAT
jgi:hypothetical protein